MDNSNMASEETYRKLRTLVAGVLDIDEERLLGDADFMDDLGVDSLMALEVMVVLERQFNVKISEKELKQIRTLHNIYSLLLQKWPK